MATRPGTTYRLGWVDVPERDATAMSARKQFTDAEVTRSRKLEGMCSTGAAWIGGDRRDDPPGIAIRAWAEHFEVRAPPSPCSAPGWSGQRVREQLVAALDGWERWPTRREFADMGLSDMRTATHFHRRRWPDPLAYPQRFAAAGLNGLYSQLLRCGDRDQIAANLGLTISKGGSHRSPVRWTSDQSTHWTDCAAAATAIRHIGSGRPGALAASADQPPARRARHGGGALQARPPARLGPAGTAPIAQPRAPDAAGRQLGDRTPANWHESGTMTDAVDRP